MKISGGIGIGADPSERGRAITPRPGAGHADAPACEHPRPMDNRFFIWPMGADQAEEIVAAEPPAADPGDPEYFHGAAHTRYFHNVARVFDEEFGGEGLTFLITWHLDRFDERFRDAVVIFVNDEKHLVPGYIADVRAVFKTGGTTPNPMRDLLAIHPSIAWRQFIRDARNAVIRRRRDLTAVHPVYEIPLGYFALTDIPLVPFAERPVDVFFAGSIEKKPFTLRPRLAARWLMAEALEETQRRMPDLRVDWSRGGPFVNLAEVVSAGTYTERLVRAKIALCPRGNFDETFRLCEVARTGGVAVCEALPQRWYFRDAPVVTVRRWSQLPDVLASLMRDPDGLAQRSEAMLRWWEECLSEETIAGYIGGRLGLAQRAASAA